MARPTSVEGWALDPTRPDQPVELELLDNNEVVTRFLAAHHRDDLKAAGIGGGNCSFYVSVPAGWSPIERHVLRVRRSCDGAELRGSPVTLDPPETFGRNLRDSLRESLRVAAEADRSEEREAALRFLVTRVDKLFRARAVADDMAPRIDMAPFYARWGELLLNRPPPVTRRPPERPAEVRRRALVVAQRYMDVLGPGMLHLTRSLARLGHELNVVTGEAHVEHRLLATTDAGGMTYHGPPLTASVEEMLGRHAGMFDVVLISGPAVALRYAVLARQHYPRARLLLSASELESMSLERIASEEERPELRVRARQALTQETIAAWFVDAVLTFNEATISVLRKVVGGTEMHLLSEDAVDEVDRCLCRVLRIPLMPV